jgi:hypothetical protein
MRRAIIIFSLLAMLLPSPSEAAWRATATEFTVYYCGPAERMERLGEVLRWKLDGSPIAWQVTLEVALQALLVSASAECPGGRTEAMWTMPRVEGEALIIPFLQAQGYDTAGLTNSQLADAFSVEFKAELLEWEAEYNAFLAAQQAPEPEAVDPLEEP